MRSSDPSPARGAPSVPAVRALRAVVALAFGLAACATPAPPVPRDTGQLVFWEIRSESGARAHLLGTVHVGRDPAAFDPAIEEALEASDVLVMEVDPADLDPTRMGQLLLQKGLLTDGRTLRDVLAPETWELLEARLEARDLDEAQVLYMEPWVALLTLMGSSLRSEGYHPTRGVEQRVLARSPAKPVLALESATFQIELFDALPLAQQERLLHGYLEQSDEPGATRDTLDRLVRAWRLGDLAALEALGMPGRGEDEDADALYDVLYLQRNRAMAESLARLLRQEPPDVSLFVMIGAMHTAGEEGVPTLLDEQGFSVRRIPRSDTGGS